MLRVYASTDQRMTIGEVGEHARRAERLGCDGLCVPEAVHDGLLAAAEALRATERLRVATCVLVAFARSPMAVAHAAWDLQASSGGRFELGLGSQVKGNVVHRYGVPWAPPVPRLREYADVLRAIFARWQHGEPLRFEGEHYRITRMQPFFDPGPLECGPPPLWLGAVGPAMTALAGEVADGLVTHPTNTSPRFLRERARPRLEHGAARRERDLAGFQLLASPLIATGPSDADVARERASIRQLLAFLYSTPSYAPTLELYGWQETGAALHRMSRAGHWTEMADAIPEAMLEALVPSAPYTEIAATIRRDYAGLITAIAFPLPADAAHDADAAAAIAALRG